MGGEGCSAFGFLRASREARETLLLDGLFVSLDESTAERLCLFHRMPEPEAPRSGGGLSFRPCFFVNTPPRF
jgi:hypothetical protein